MRNKFRNPNITQEQLVVWSMNNKPAIVSQCNYKQRSGEQSMFKLMLLTSKGKLMETSWIPENQLTKIN